MESIKRSINDASTFVSRAVQDANIQDEASVVFNRAKQYTEEKLGKAERTDLDPHIIMLEKKTENTKNYTERIKNNAAAVLVPNPAARAESLLFDNIPVDKIGIKNERLTNLEYLGNDMIEAGNEFGSTTPYGSALIRVGQTEKKLGIIEKEFIRSGNEGMIAPLQRFLDGEMKNIMRERKVLENKRLDLDACKNKVRKARALQMQQQAENELRLSQSEFDRQVEITRLLMEGLSQTQTNHLRHLTAYVDSQVQYYAQAHQVMQELHRELSSFSPSPTPLTQTPKRGQVLLDYDSESPEELSLMAHEVLNIYELTPEEEDFVMGERLNKTGRVPRAYIKLIS